MRPITVVLDIETVPDRLVWQPEQAAVPIDLTKCEKCKQPLEPEEDKVRKCSAMTRGKCRFPSPVEGKADPFPPLWACQIIAIGFAVFDHDINSFVSLDAVGASVPQEEKLILTSLNDFLAENNANIVTWNGRGFDSPVIMLRSLRHGISCQQYIDALGVDMQDRVTPLGFPRRSFSLDELSRLIGLPGKNGVDGSMIERMFKTDGVESVRNYCLNDVVETAYLWLRDQLIRSPVNVDKYKTACESLKKLWQGRIGFESWNEATIDFGRLELF